MKVLAILALTLLPVPGLAEETRQTVRRAADAPVPVGTVDEMAWLAGRWVGDGLGGRVEEIWSPPEGGVMMGMFRLVRDDKPVFYEFLTLRHTERGLAMQLKHFNPDMTGWEEREKFVEFLYVGREENRVFFEGLTFVREGENGVTIHLALRGNNGSVREERFRMRRTAEVAKAQ